ncbi:MAG: hypothetical protein HGA90_00025 [Alphaproteobacteria bacterium]|nr:hypothetical protein [Alphaproteobacteria bacterium]
MTELPSVRKFLFDHAFDSMSPGVTERAKIKKTFTEEQLDAAKQEAHQTGFSEGKKAMLASQEQAQNTLFSKLQQQLGQLTEASSEQWQIQSQQMQEVALIIARKVIPNYVTRQGLDEIQALIAQVISEMAHEPRLVVRVGEAQFDTVSVKIKEITDRQAYSGKVVVLAEESLGPSDCRVEWADGGIERDLATFWQELDRIVERIQNSGHNPVFADKSPSDESGDKA